MQSSAGKCEESQVLLSGGLNTDISHSVSEGSEHLDHGQPKSERCSANLSALDSDNRGLKEVYQGK